MATRSYDIEMAAKIGVAPAVVLETLILWIGLNRAKGENEHDGKFWTTVKISEMKAFFPEFTDREIIHNIKKLKNAGIIMSKRFGEDYFDQTRSYTLTDLYYKEFVGDYISGCAEVIHGT